jgi:hypothetical protein
MIELSLWDKKNGQMYLLKLGRTQPYFTLLILRE